MSRLLLFLLLGAIPSVAQTPKSPSNGKQSVLPTADNKWLNEVEALQNRARQVLKAEFSRKADPVCNPEKLSNAEYANCFAKDEAITEHNYQAFAKALQASLSIAPPDIDPKIFPLPSKNFAAGEAAWRSYADKICAALGDTFYGGTAAPTDMTGCQQDLTRQHMKDLASLFLHP